MSLIQHKDYFKIIVVCYGYYQLNISLSFSFHGFNVRSKKIHGVAKLQGLMSARHRRRWIITRLNAEYYFAFRFRYSITHFPNDS
jgi:hypothetical protein